MNTYRVRIAVTVELDAFTPSDAADVALDSIYETEGLGVNVVDTTVTEVEER